MASRIKIQIKDRLKYSPLVRSLRCGLAARLERMPPADDPEAIARSIHRLCTAARNATGKEQMLKVEELIHQRVRLLGGRSFDWREIVPESAKTNINCCAVIKPYLGPGEKGVLLISFDFQWARLMQHYHGEKMDKLAERYDLVVCTVWAEPHCVMNYVLPEQWKGRRIFATISDPDDEEIIPRFSEKYVVAPVLCSNWVNPGWYEPLEYEKKDIDFFMLANFGEYKRHWRLFKAMRRMPADLKVVLIGTHNGDRDEKTILAEAEAFGIPPGRIDLRRSVPHDEVRDTFVRSRCSLIFSLREGSCMAIVESMFAGTPVGMFDNAKVGSRKFINEQTGRFLNDRNLSAQLMDFLKDSGDCNPRKWVEDNRVDCFGSSSVLNEVIKKKSLADGDEWTRDTFSHQWSPHPELAEHENYERVRADYEYIENEIGIDLNGFPGDRENR